MKHRFSLVIFSFVFSIIACGQEPETSTKPSEVEGKITKTDDEWKSCLDSETYYVTREKGTEPAFSGKYNKHKEKGEYLCSNCQNKLFSSDHKYDSGSGWPSFYDVASNDGIKEVKDVSLGMKRTEIVCQKCDAHLGHVFNDGPNPTGLRYCVNSLSLEFEPKKSDK